MILAKDKNGRIGRQIPGVGEQAQVQYAPEAGHRGNVYLSTRSIEADQAYYAREEQERIAKVRAERLRNIVKRNAQRIEQEARAKEIQAHQGLGSYDSNRERLRQHYARKNAMGETESVISSLLRTPADFSESGANPQIVESDESKRPVVWRADFRQELVVGNPLTRDGEFGPAITDYDRYMTGVDVNQTDVVAGGTMLGRYDGSNAPAGMGIVPFTVKQPQFRKKLHPHGVPSGMGHSAPAARRSRPEVATGPMGSWWDSATDWVTGVATSTVDNLSNSLPKEIADQIQKELNDIIAGGGDAHVNPATGQIVVTRPVTGTTTTVAQSLGVPPWAIYAGLGLMGVGVLFVLIKAVKS